MAGEPKESEGLVCGSSVRKHGRNFGNPIFIFVQQE